MGGTDAYDRMPDGAFVPTAVEIAPSILAADFAFLGDAIGAVERGGASILHVDVMDGHFVPNISIGVPVVASLRKATRLPLDVHLMIENPEQYIGAFAEAGADMISVHQEATPHLDRALTMIREHGCRPGAVINPATPVAHALRGAWQGGSRAGDVGESGVWGAVVYPRIDSQNPPAPGFA